ncbi:MAG: NAD(P)H-dependent oxidoreductase [Pseudomonadota bacterium]
MANPKLLTISGSLRKGSYNRQLLAVAVEAFGPADVTEADLNLPLYDGDLEEAEGVPDSVTKLAEQVKGADAILIASPEYNKGIPGVLKNAFDWISRVPGGAFKGKPCVVMSAAAGRSGGECANYMVVSCLLALHPRLLPGPMVLVAGAHNEFDENGKLSNKLYLDGIKERMTALREAAS